LNARENGNNETIDIQFEDHSLMLRLHDNDASTIEGTCIPLDEARFAWSGGLIEFEIADDGTVPALTAMQVCKFERVSGMTDNDTGERRAIST